VDSLPDWVVSIIAVAVGLSPGLAILMAGPVGRFLRRVLFERPEVAPQSGREPVREGPAVATPPAGRGPLELISRQPSDRPLTGAHTYRRDARAERIATLLPSRPPDVYPPPIHLVELSWAAECLRAPARPMVLSFGLRGKHAGSRRLGQTRV
jgi:hypothetical protein